MGKRKSKGKVVNGVVRNHDAPGSFTPGSTAANATKRWPELKYKLFCYGTLNVHDIQRGLWGEAMQGKPFQLRNFELKMWPSSAIFYIERKPGEVVTGKVYELTREQLESTDVYESDAYERIRVEGEKVSDDIMVYVKANGGSLL